VQLVRKNVNDAKFKEFPGYGHFTYNDIKTQEFPELLEELLK